MGNTPVVKLISVALADGWKKLSDTSLVANIEFRFSATDISMRIDQGTGVALNVQNQNFRMWGVDLSRIEVSTTNAAARSVYVVGSTRGA